MTAPAQPTAAHPLQAQRDHHARLCADLLDRGHLAEAKQHARESERLAALIRAAAS